MEVSFVSFIQNKGYFLRNVLESPLEVSSTILGIINVVQDHNLIAYKLQRFNQLLLSPENDPISV